MSDIVARLRDWRNVHLARLHLLMEEAADQIAILESKLSLRENLEQGLMAGVARLQAEVERLRNGALEASGTVSQDGDFPVPDNAANRDNTPATHATPSQGSVQSECTLTDAEREAVQWAAAMEPEPNGRWTKAQEKTWNKRAATLRGLLERME